MSDRPGSNELMRAASTGRLCDVKYWMRRHDPLERDARGQTALILAAGFGSLSCVKALLPVSDALAVDADLRHALHRAADSVRSQNGAVACVAELALLCDPNAKDRKGRTPLMLAIDRQRPCRAEVLIPVSDCLLRNDFGQTPLMMAAAHGMTSLVAELLPHSHAFAKDDARWNALMWAANHGHLDVVDLLTCHMRASRDQRPVGMTGRILMA